MINLLEQDRIRTILVVDDEDIVRKSFCDSLEDLGYKTLDAANGKCGLQLALSASPDLILTDLRMPIMGGIELLGNCSAKLPSVPVVVISGAGLMEDVINALRLGAFDYLTKPIKDPSLLQAVIDRALKQVELAEQNREYQKHLEQLVEARTAQLVEINQQLVAHQEQLEQQVDLRTQELRTAITDLKSAQSQLIESAKMASLGRLVAGVSHELNTPLGICLTFISSLGQKLAVFEKDFYAGKLRREDFEKFLGSAQESSQIVISNLTQVSELIHNFKMVSVDVSSDMKREFDLTEYIANIISSLRCETYETEINLTASGLRAYKIYSFPGFFSQIFTNLIMNSMSHGFSAHHVGRIDIDVCYEVAAITLTYQDNGKGMEEAVLEQLYEPFFTTARSSGGSGLGMNVLYNLVVNNLSGTVSCKSSLGEGVTFTIKLPKP